MQLGAATFIAPILLFYACVLTSSAMALHVFPGRHFDKQIRDNCTKCNEKLKISLTEVLPRLTLIKQRIMNALGRSGDNEEMRNDSPYAQDTRQEPQQWPDVPTTQLPVPRRKSRINEIISFSEPTGTSQGDPVMTFRVSSPENAGDIEAISASLLLYVERRRKIRKGGRGKKIALQISKMNPDNNSEEILTYLRTRVKRCKWKRLSLPVTIAQSLIDTDKGTLDIKVKCTGCGRLVKLVLYGFKRPVNKRAKRQRSGRAAKAKYRHRKLTRNRGRHRHRKGSSPMLVISTRYRV